MQTNLGRAEALAPTRRAGLRGPRRPLHRPLADIAANARQGKNAPPISPVALETVKRIDLIFDVERDINGLNPSHEGPAFETLHLLRQSLWRQESSVARSACGRSRSG
jgi:hypothetical protein